MKELNFEEVNSISGGEANWAEAGVGIGMFAVSIAIAATPVGLLGMGAAAAFSYFGGTLIGSGISGNDVWGLE